MRRLKTKDVQLRMRWDSRETLRSRIKAGLFPPPMRDPGSTINYWLETDVDNYLREQAEAHGRVGIAAEQVEA